MLRLPTPTRGRDRQPEAEIGAEDVVLALLRRRLELSEQLVRVEAELAAWCSPAPSSTSIPGRKRRPKRAAPGKVADPH